MEYETAKHQKVVGSLEWIHQPFVPETAHDGWDRPVPDWLGDTEHLASVQMLWQTVLRFWARLLYHISRAQEKKVHWKGSCNNHIVYLGDLGESH